MPSEFEEPTTISRDLSVTMKLGDTQMDTNTLLIIILVLLLLGGGGWYGRGRWY
jgi:LPXTG-motif cell wall-anchored protein